MKTINLRTMLLTCFAFISAFVFTVSARDTYYYSISEPKVGDVKESYDRQKPLPEAKFLETWFTPPISGQGAILGFGLREDKSGTSHLPTFWAQKGKCSYHYTYGKDGGKVYRQLFLYSSEFPHELVLLQIKSDYSGSLYVGFVSNNKIYDALVTGSDAKRLFLWAARKVRDLGFPKHQKDTLFIDVDF